MRKLFEERLYWRLQPQPNGCWEWQGYRNPAGYGQLTIKGEQHMAHRLAWSLAHDEDLGDRYALHRCDNPPCCNPMHVYAGTERDNAEDRTLRGLARGNPTGGEEHYRTRLSLAQVTEMRKLRSEGMKLRELAEMYEMSVPGVGAITTGRTWKNDWTNGRPA